MAPPFYFFVFPFCFCWKCGSIEKNTRMKKNKKKDASHKKKPEKKSCEEEKKKRDQNCYEKRKKKRLFQIRQTRGPLLRFSWICLLPFPFSQLFFSFSLPDLFFLYLPLQVIFLLTFFYITLFFDIHSFSSELFL
ncbi:MAG: hypothetical protein JOS17DRAFT_197054 [Linnemannia elongata]|nr:MAG: hypothetical protein JOS17DRAFT_197054 [Linnemannia elongata]